MKFSEIISHEDQVAVVQARSHLNITVNRACGVLTHLTEVIAWSDVRKAVL